MRLFLFGVLLFSVLACSKDEEEEEIVVQPMCIESDWIGTYAGMEDCSGDVQDGEVIIADEGGEISMRLQTPGVSVPFEDITISGCSASGVNGLIRVNATLMGDQISVTTNVLGIICTYSCERQ